MLLKKTKSGKAATPTTREYRAYLRQRSSFLKRRHRKKYIAVWISKNAKKERSCTRPWKVVGFPGATLSSVQMPERTCVAPTAMSKLIPILDHLPACTPRCNPSARAIMERPKRVKVRI